MHFTISFPVLFAVMIGSHTQTFPRIFFDGALLPNHSYVPFREVGHDASAKGSGVECRTDLSTCCGGQGDNGRAWYFPNGTRLSFSQYLHTYMRRASKKVVLYKGSRFTDGHSGIHRCAVPTVSSSPGMEVVYVGIYNGNDGKRYSGVFP